MWCFQKKKKSSRASEIALNLFINCRHSKNSCRFKLAWGLFFSRSLHILLLSTQVPLTDQNCCHAILSCNSIVFTCGFECVWMSVSLLMGCMVGSVQCLLLSEGFLINLKPFLFCDVVKFIEQNLTSDFIGSLRVRIILHVSWYWPLRRLIS